MMDSTITLVNPVHGTFKVEAEALADILLRPIGTASLLHIQREIAELVGSYINPIDGSHDYSDLDRAEALIVYTYLTGGSAD
jgi:hypothetical protein